MQMYHTTHLDTPGLWEAAELGPKSTSTQKTTAAATTTGQQQSPRGFGTTPSIA